MPKIPLMDSFHDFKINKQLHFAIEDLGYDTPTEIQTKSFAPIGSGKDVVGIAQTGTGKTFAYMLPLISGLKFSKQIDPRILVLVPTRELVLQVVDEIKKFGKYSSIRVVGVYGGVNINTHKEAVWEGADIIVATPGRLYDLILSRALKTKHIKKLVIDEVDVMLDLGFRFQLTNIFELLQEQRQNIMYSATMTDDVAVFINDFFKNPTTISVAVSGTPLDNIKQTTYDVPNFYTKANVVCHLLKDKEVFTKTLVFVPNKKRADLLYELLQETFKDDVAVIHSNKTQNYRIRSIENFNANTTRILVTTDIMARGLDLDLVSHVINVDTPRFPENYMHRIGRTGRAQAQGTSILLTTEKEQPFREDIETLMGMTIEKIDIAKEVEISTKLTLEEQPDSLERENPHKQQFEEGGTSFHEKSEKNSQTNQGGSYKRIIKLKYKKARTKGDKNFNQRNKQKGKKPF